MQQTKKTTLYLISSGVLAYLLKYFFTLFLTHHLQPKLYGDFAIGMRILGIVATITLLGTNTSSNRFLAFFLEQHQSEQVHDYIGWNLRLITNSFLICFALALLSVFVMTALHFSGIKHIASYHFSVYMLWIAPLAASVSLLSSFLLSARHHQISSLMQSVKYLLEIVFFVGAVVVLELILNEFNMAIILFFVMLVLLLVEVVILRIKSPALLSRNTFSAFFKRSENHEAWFLTSINLIINNISFLIICVVDLLIVKALSPHEYDVACYAVVLTISSLFYVITGNAYNHIKPRVSVLLRSPESCVELQQLFDKSNQIVMMISAFVLCLIIVFSKELLGHFGESYIAASVPLILVSISACIASFSKAPTSLISYSGHEKKLIKINVIQFILLIVLLSPLTYFYGITGTAVGTMIVSVYQVLSTAVIARRLGIRTLFII